jgi:hypothetical protein
MDRDSLFEYVFEESTLFEDWHWFNYHFGNGRPFAVHIVDACLECEEEMDGFAKSFLDKLFSISGRKKYRPHYEQLMQMLAELLMIRQMVSFDWGEDANFTHEPTPVKGNKNPELIVELDGYDIGVEVKCPSLLDHVQERSSKPFQIPARSIVRDTLNSMLDREEEENVVLPRDNPVKDFLISANKKFEPFKADEENFCGILVVVWDDYIFEPISALLSPLSGLFTEESFACDEEGNPLPFEYVDGVIIIRHLHQFVRAAAERPLLDSKIHVLDYGTDGDFPPKAFVPNPNGNEVPDKVTEAFQAYLPSPEMGAEYLPTDMITWM